jgi:hypothetical protein
MSEIPGLLGIEDQACDDGSCRLAFQIEDDRVADFYTAFGLEPGDISGLQVVVNTALERYLEARGVPNDKSTG